MLRHRKALSNSRYLLFLNLYVYQGYVSLKLNDEQIESTVEEDLITTNDYVIKVISNGNIENKDDIRFHKDNNLIYTYEMKKDVYI